MDSSLPATYSMKVLFETPSKTYIYEPVTKKRVHLRERNCDCPLRPKENQQKSVRPDTAAIQRTISPMVFPADDGLQPCSRRLFWRERKGQF